VDISYTWIFVARLGLGVFVEVVRCPCSVRDGLSVDQKLSIDQISEINVMHDQNLRDDWVFLGEVDEFVCQELDCMYYRATRTSFGNASLNAVKGLVRTASQLASARSRRTPVNTGEFPSVRRRF